MRKERKVEFLITTEELRLIQTKRKKRMTKSFRKTRRIKKIKLIKEQLVQNAPLIRQRIAGICLILLGAVSAYVSRNEPDSGELVFTSVILVVFGLVLLLSKHNLESYKEK